MRIGTRSGPDLLDLVQTGWDRTAMGARRRGRAGILAGFLAVVALAVSGCTPSSGTVGTPVPLPATSSPPAGSPSPSPAVPTGPVQPAGDPSDVVSGLQAPWSVLPVDGS